MDRAVGALALLTILCRATAGTACPHSRPPHHPLPRHHGPSVARSALSPLPRAPPLVLPALILALTSILATAGTAPLSYARHLPLPASPLVLSLNHPHTALLTRPNLGRPSPVLPLDRRHCPLLYRGRSPSIAVRTARRWPSSHWTGLRSDDRPDKPRLPCSRTGHAFGQTTPLPLGWTENASHTRPGRSLPIQLGWADPNLSPTGPGRSLPHTARAVLPPGVVLSDGVGGRPTRYVGSAERGLIRGGAAASTPGPPTGAPVRCRPLRHVGPVGPGRLPAGWNGPGRCGPLGPRHSDVVSSPPLSSSGPGAVPERGGGRWCRRAGRQRRGRWRGRCDGGG